MMNAINMGEVITLIKTMTPGVSDEAVSEAVSDWITAHPEAVTTVQDGSITEQKLASALATKINQSATAVSTLSDEIVALKPVYGKSKPTIPLFPELAADFAWCAMVLPGSFISKNVVMTVSGTAGENELTVSAITPVAMADFSTYDRWIGGVLTTDGKAYKTYNFKYKTDTTLEIFPALDTDITDATLATLMLDSGTSYVGMHLTEHGYRAYMYYLYNVNPKHCEASKYIAKYCPYKENETNPFVKYGGTSYLDTASRVNVSNVRFSRYATSVCSLYFAPSYTPHNTKTGLLWDNIDLKGKSGYCELFVAASNSDDAKPYIPEGQETYVDVWIDGVLASQTILRDYICKRICVDFTNAHTGKIDIYCNKWAPIYGGGSGFSIGRVCWYVNEQEYSTPIFPKNAVIAQMFDSWGVFHNGVSGVALSALHNDAAGVTVPFTNHSLGSQTSAWGKAWFYENVWKYNPSICVTDFLINDNNSNSPSFSPTTIAGPDGTEYNNIITGAQYAENQQTIINEALNNGIQPIVMRAFRTGQTNDIMFSVAMIDALSVKV